MKKNVFIALAMAVVAFAGPTVALAAPSPTAADTTILANVVEVANTQGTTSALSLETLTEANKEARKIVADIIKAAYADTADAAAINAAGELVINEQAAPLGASAEPELVAAFEFTPAEEVKERIQKKGSAEITFEVADVKAGDAIKVLHQLANGSWEVIEPSSVKDGEVKAVFTSFSPVVITKLPVEVAKLDTTAKASSFNYYILIAIVLVAIVAIVGVCVFGTKSNKKHAKVRR